MTDEQLDVQLKSLDKTTKEGVKSRQSAIDTLVRFNLIVEDDIDDSSDSGCEEFSETQEEEE